MVFESHQRQEASGECGDLALSALEFQINTYTSAVQGELSVASDSDGDFFVVWQSYGAAGTDSSGETVQGQRFGDPGFAGACVSADGFGSATTSSWSNSVP